MQTFTATALDRGNEDTLITVDIDEDAHEVNSDVNVPGFYEDFASFAYEADAVLADHDFRRVSDWTRNEKGLNTCQVEIAR